MGKQLALAIALLLAPLALVARAAPLAPPPELASQNGLLDVVMVARPATLTLDGSSPTGWVYQICRRTTAAQQSCPGTFDRAAAQVAYGGTHLSLQPGDTLKVRLVNQLPPLDDAAAVDDYLKANPTNLHTHGLIVEPRRKTPALPTWGDFVFVLAYPKGVPLPSLDRMGLATESGFADYQIELPKKHPPGLFWFHPHAHGLALLQVTSGLAGVITVGDHRRYARGTQARLLVLKDIQVDKANHVLEQKDTAICPRPATGARPGFCSGSDGTRWFFTINGQVHPSISVGSAGEVWRIANTSASASYLLALERKDGTRVPMQVVAVDGVSVTVANAASADASAKSALARFFGRATKMVDCPGKRDGRVCVSQVGMMPSSRVELFVAGKPGDAVLRTVGYSTGLTPQDGDNWPAVDLASVTLGGAGAPPAVAGDAGPIVESTASEPALVKVEGQPSLVAVDDVRNRPELKSAADELARASAEKCDALGDDQRRAVIFGAPPGNANGFGLAYQVWNAHGDVVPGSDSDGEIVPFAHAAMAHWRVCVPLAEHDKPRWERWELVNITAEDHNFHMHQTKFIVVGNDALANDLGSLLQKLGRAAVLHDNVPVPHGDAGCDGMMATYRQHKCTPGRVTVLIPFSQVGEFVYHCHILEHEDGGMMARIKVSPYRKR
jgi:L-ascorbate oxidase